MGKIGENMLYDFIEDIKRIIRDRAIEVYKKIKYLLLIGLFVMAKAKELDIEGE